MPDKVHSAFLPSVYQNGVGKSAKTPIEMLSDDEGTDDDEKENKVHQEGEEIYGIPESSIVYGPQESYTLHQDSDSSEAESDSSATEVGGGRPWFECFDESRPISEKNVTNNSPKFLRRPYETISTPNTSDFGINQ